MVLLIDNYDSFVHNLARYIRCLGYETQVVRNDKITLTQISNLNPSHIILSPGPCTPDGAGITLKVIECLAQSTPILGVCLGHQAIGQVYGGKVGRAMHPMHGKSSKIKHTGKGLFEGVPASCRVGRYHSLIVENHSFPSSLDITALSEEQEVMALQHPAFPLYGVQFHPESILTPDGSTMLANFLLRAWRKKVAACKFTGC
jgi:anthranilate synthase component 2